MFKTILYNIRDDVSSFSEDKIETMKKSVSHKLDRSLKNYQENIELNARYIMTRSNYKVLKTIDRMAKKKN